MVGRMFYLPDADDRVMLDAQNGAIDNQLSFHCFLRDAAERLVNKDAAAFSWEDGWNIMLMEHAMVLSDARHSTIPFKELKQQTEAKLESEQ